MQLLDHLGLAYGLVGRHEGRDVITARLFVTNSE
jgi:hypothetical protein